MLSTYLTVVLLSTKHYTHYYDATDHVFVSIQIVILNVGNVSYIDQSGSAAFKAWIDSEEQIRIITGASGTTIHSLI